MNARRAATAVSVEQERARSDELARASERKLLALRERAEREAIAQQSAEEAARAAAKSAYERRFADPNAPQDGQSGDAETAAEVPSFGAPLGPVLPSISESVPPNIFTETNQSPNQPNLEVAVAEPAVAEPPVSEVQGTPPPQPELEEVAIIPRPFRVADGVVASH